MGYACHYQVTMLAGRTWYSFFMTWNNLHRKIIEVEKILLNLIFYDQENKGTESGNSRHLSWLPYSLRPIIVQSYLLTAVQLFNLLCIQHPANLSNLELKNRSVISMYFTFTLFTLPLYLPYLQPMLNIVCTALFIKDLLHNHTKIRFWTNIKLQVICMSQITRHTKKTLASSLCYFQTADTGMKPVWLCACIWLYQVRSLGTE